MTDDTPLAALWRFSRMLRLADGPDEVHKVVLARRELNRRGPPSLHEGVDTGPSLVIMPAGGFR
jgi:acyl-CoA dehydrogenase